MKTLLIAATALALVACNGNGDAPSGPPTPLDPNAPKAGDPCTTPADGTRGGSPGKLQPDEEREGILVCVAGSGIAK